MYGVGASARRCLVGAVESNVSMQLPLSSDSILYTRKTEYSKKRGFSIREHSGAREFYRTKKGSLSVSLEGNVVAAILDYLVMTLYCTISQS